MIAGLVIAALVSAPGALPDNPCKDAVAAVHALDDTDRWLDVLWRSKRVGSVAQVLNGYPDLVALSSDEREALFSYLCIDARWMLKDGVRFARKAARMIRKAKKVCGPGYDFDYQFVAVDDDVSYLQTMIGVLRGTVAVCDETDKLNRKADEEMLKLQGRR